MFLRLKSLPLLFILFQDYQIIYNEKENYKALFEKLRNLVLFQGAISITPESWSEIERLWRLLETQVSAIYLNIFLC